MTNQAILDILNHLCNEARNSIHATFGLMELLPETPLEGAWETNLAAGRSSADRLLRSIDDLRELLMVTPPGSEFLEEFDVGLCLGEIVDLLNLASADKAVRLLYDAPREPLRIVQDRHSMEQTISRLLDSASKLTPAGSMRITSGSAARGVRIGLINDDSTLIVRLSDWLNADQNRIQFPDESAIPLALAVMVAGKRIRALGGAVQIVCESGTAAQLSITLPSLEGEGRNGEPKHENDGLSVLVTEDCDESFALSEMLLNKEIVRRARDGQEAVELVKKHRFDVVLMDIHMPGMDGYAAINQIRSWETESGNARTPIVVLSSDDLDTQRRAAAQAGCSGFLRKPLRNRELQDMIERLKGDRYLTS